MTAAPSSQHGRVLLPSLTRWLLAVLLITAGVGHLTFLREEFQAQVPDWLPVDPDMVVVVSGLVELALGAALLLASGAWRARVGWAVAAFFVVIFPGNVAQYLEGTDAFGLDTDAARAVRLAFQPVLIVAALWSTGAWATLRTKRAEDRHLQGW